jgi:hypothetical protein
VGIAALGLAGVARECLPYDRRVLRIGWQKARAMFDAKRSERD